MSHLIRSAKSGSNWTLNELDSYNIHLERQEAPKFFGVPLLPDPAVDPELLQHLEADDMHQDRNAELINLLDLAMLPTGSGETPLSTSPSSSSSIPVTFVGVGWRVREGIYPSSYAANGKMRRQTSAS